MKITVKLFATLTNGRFNNKVFECRDGISVKEMLKTLEIGEKDYFITFINNRHSTPEQILNDGDVLAVFPAVGGG